MGDMIPISLFFLPLLTKEVLVSIELPPSVKRGIRK
jgi:hypothetical protein